MPADTWAAQPRDAPYAAASLASEGFIHCTDGADELLATADRHYRADPRSFVALTVDLDRCGSPWRIEDARGIYPHIYGPIAPDAIVDERAVRRAGDGRFVELGPSDRPDGSA